MLGLKKYPSFSVLMSVYKNENPLYLDKSLSSIESQTIIPDEIILVEDGPVSLEIKKVISKHKKSFKNNFKNIISKRNRGLGAALRLGTKYVSTEWIARMDSDDISLPNRFEIQLLEIQKHPQLSVIGGQVAEFMGDTQQIVGYRKVPLSQKLIRNFSKWRSPFNHPTVMINKSTLQSVGGYISYGNLEDYYLWARIIASDYAVKNVKDVLTLMRVDNGMYSRRGKISNIKYIFSLRKYLRTKKIINYIEEIVGDLILTVNIIIPRWMRKVLYRNYLHTN